MYFDTILDIYINTILLFDLSVEFGQIERGRRLHFEGALVIPLF